MLTDAIKVYLRTARDAKYLLTKVTKDLEAFGLNGTQRGELLVQDMEQDFLHLGSAQPIGKPSSRRL